MGCVVGCFLVSRIVYRGGQRKREKGKGRKEGRNPGCIACTVVLYYGRRMGDEGREGKRGWHPSTIILQAT